MGISSAPHSTVPTGLRLGFHYFPDTLHYREADLQAWLPELQDLGASWLVLRSELDRAIPERFLVGLKQAGIEPIIQFPLSLQHLPDPKETAMLLEIYARWGARYLVFYDRPNARASWPAAGWAQQDLVERFLDRFLPVATQALQQGLTPVFPPLEPGGSYWDTAFLRSALQAIQRRRQDALLEKLVLSAYAWSHGRSLDWGGGGPERWPQARPYLELSDVQDQRGFRIFDWYLAVARSVLQQPSQMMLFQAGLPGDPYSTSAVAAGEQATAGDYLNIARLLASETVSDPRVEGNELEPIPDQVIACNFWLLAADPASPHAAQAWYDDHEHRRAPAEALHAWQRDRRSQAARPKNEKTLPGRPIQHYLLLPGAEWGVSDWYLEVIRPFVKKYRPTVGFSPAEAEQAARVTIVGNALNFPSDLLSRLQTAGCWVEQISGDGTNIASELAER